MRFMPLLASCLLMATSSCVAEESDYNLGVDAYQKKAYSEAAAHWKKSVARGDVNAMNNLGFLLYHGYGVPKDLEAAIDLWRVASFAGNSEAQWHLGGAYETGVGVQEDPVKAYAWYRCSMESASAKVRSKTDVEVESGILKDATDSVHSLSEKLSSLELASGQAAAADYIARYAKPAP